MQKNTYSKIGRFISLLLTVVLVCSMIPMNANANDEMVSLFDEEQDMERNNIEEDETKSILPSDNDLAILEEEATETAAETIPEAFVSPQSETVIVNFDLDDGTYTKFYGVIVQEGGKVTDRPADPTREGYVFKGWYGYVDGNNEPVMWDFENDTVPGNMVLWAAWEKAYLVMYDINDG